MAPSKVAVIGYGLSAKIFHIPFIKSLPSEFTLHGILQRNPSSANNAANDHPDVKVFSALEGLLEDASIELVVVTSIPSAHFEQCKRSLEAGKHVLCEKPFVPTAAEALELAAVAQTAKRTLTVYQNRRFDADFLTLKDILSQERLGRVVDVHSHFDRHRPYPPTPEKAGWKARPDEAGVGAIYDLGSHLLDQAVGLWGLPLAVTAFIGNQRVYTDKGTGGEAGGDSFTVILRYSTGMMVTLRAGVFAAEKKMLRWWVRGDKGSFWKYGLDVQEDQLKAGLRPGNADFGIDSINGSATITKVDPGSGEITEHEMKQPKPPVTYVGFYEALAQAINGKDEVPVSAIEAAKVLRLIEAARESSNQGHTIEL